MEYLTKQLTIILFLSAPLQCLVPGNVYAADSPSSPASTSTKNSPQIPPKTEVVTHMSGEVREDSSALTKEALIQKGKQILSAKVYTIGQYRGVKNDGETAFTLDNTHVTLYHIREANGTLSTEAVIDFHLTNHTQNDKGEHHHYFVATVLGPGGNALPFTVSVPLQRDTCHPSNPVITRPYPYIYDVYDVITGVSWGWHGRWNYEGKC